MAIADLAGRWQSVNAALGRALGIAPDRLTGKSLADVSHAEDLPAHQEQLARMRSGEITRYQIETRLLHQRGTAMWFAVHAVAISGGDGEPPYVLMQFQDVTERKFAEIGRHAGLIVDDIARTNAPGVVYQYVYRPDGSRAFTMVSEGIRGLLEIEPEVALHDSMSVFSLVHPDDRAEVFRTGAESTATLTPWRFEARMVLASGVEKVILAASRPVRQPDGSVLCDGILIDVTERHRAAKQLEESEQRYRSLFDHHPDAVFMVDLEGRFKSVNPGCFELAGYLPHELLDQSFERFVVPDDLPTALWRFRAALNGVAQRYQVAIIHKNGRRVDIDATNIPVVIGGRVTAVFGIVRDQTAQRLLEAQLRQSQKMEAIGQLAGGVAHDFNNILAAISGYAELLQADFADGDGRRDDVEEILKGTRRAASLTRQLLAFSRKQVMQPETFDVNEVVADMSTMLTPLLGATLRLELKPAPEPALVRADRTQFEQVLLNLAVNARDAMPSGGTVTLAVRHEESGPGGEPSVVLAVSDTGSGMPPEVEARVFEPFFTTKPLGEGTGLGLSMVHGIVQQSGGTISVASQPGAGATFTVSLPRVTSVPDAEPGDLTPVQRGRPATVLVAEDEDAVRTITGRILERAGYRVLLAKNGVDALRVLDAHQGDVDLLLSDVAMPEMGGPELARQVAVRRPELPVLLMSGYAEGRLNANDSATYFLPKPFTVESLLAAVRRAAR